MSEKNTVLIDGKQVTLKHVEAGYSTPKATKWLDTALGAEARNPDSNMMEKALDKACEYEAKGE